MNTKSSHCTRHNQSCKTGLFVAIALFFGACTAPTSLPSAAEIQAADPMARSAQYLGNAGVMITDGQTKILFDPLFDQGFNTYQLVPPAIRDPLMAGTKPFDGVDLLLISHAHGDHFSAKQVLAYLKANPAVKLVAPAQAVVQLSKAGLSPNDLDERVMVIDQKIGAPPVFVQAGAITIEAITIPHSGGERFASVRNTVYRVDLGEQYHVLHLGDATIENPPFAAQQVFWDAQSNDLVLTPYWLFKNQQRQVNLDLHVQPLRAIGIHVPTALSALKQRYGTALDEVDLFTRPGEVRDLSDDE